MMNLPQASSQQQEVPCERLRARSRKRGERCDGTGSKKKDLVVLLYFRLGGQLKKKNKEDNQKENKHGGLLKKKT